jgi:hypothetical protein
MHRANEKSRNQIDFMDVNFSVTLYHHHYGLHMHGIVCFSNLVPRALLDQLKL